MALDRQHPRSPLQIYPEGREKEAHFEEERKGDSVV